MFVEDLEMYLKAFTMTGISDFLDLDMTGLQIYKSATNSYLGIGTKESIVYAPGTTALLIPKYIERQLVWD